MSGKSGCIVCIVMYSPNCIVEDCTIDWADIAERDDIFFVTEN